jgi:arylsulfatase A-like enzyme
MKISNVIMLFLMVIFCKVPATMASPNIIKEVQTPNVDRLAKEGIRFSQFYVKSPICSPSRCALVTGQYPYRWKINSFLNNRAETENLATKHPDRVNHLAKALLECNKSMPADNGHVKLNTR